MKHPAVLCFLATILWQCCDVKGWNIQESIKKFLETTDNVEDYDIAFPLVITPDVDTRVARPRRHASRSEFQGNYASRREEHDTANPLFVEDRGDEEVGIDNEDRDISEENMNRNVSCETDNTGIKASSANNHNISINLESAPVVQQRRDENYSRWANNEFKTEKKFTFFESKGGKESENAGSESSEGENVTIIALKGWILEVRTNPILQLQDGFQAEWVSNEQKQSVKYPESCKLQTGFVRGVVNSVVALTTCDPSPTNGSDTEDIAGLIRVNGDSYFVQPLVSTGGTDRERPHLIYRVKTNLELIGDQDFGDKRKLFGSDSRQTAITGPANNELCDVGEVTSGCLKRSKRESYWRHDMTELKYSNTSVTEEISSTERELDLYLVDEPEGDLEHNRAVIEHIREELKREEEVGYFIDSDLETEGKREDFKNKNCNC